MAVRGDVSFVGVPNDGSDSFAFRISFPPNPVGDGKGDIILFLPNLSHLQPERGDEVLVAFEHGGGVAGTDGLSNTIAFGEWKVAPPGGTDEFVEWWT